jgi:spermidine/putrescine transport system substrate-binding protein
MRLMFDNLKEIFWSERSVRRREVLKLLGVAGIAATAVPLLPCRSQADDQASYLTWAGYDISELQPHYKEKYHAEPNWAVFSNPADAFEKLRGGSVADVIHPCSESVPRWREAGVIQPIDVTRLTNWPSVHPVLRHLPASLIEGRNYFVPWEWGIISISYRTDLVELPGGEESWAILWDERNKGKVSILDSASDSWWCAAIYAGLSLDKIDDAVPAKVHDLLMKLKPNVRLFTSDPTTVERGLASGEIVAAVTWAETARVLQSQRLPVRFAKPKEGALNWTCGLVLNSKAPHIEKAHDLIDGMLARDVGAYCIRNFGYGHSNLESFAQVDNADLARIGLPRNPSQLLESGHFKSPVPSYIAPEIIRNWSEVRSEFNEPDDICSCAGPKALQSQLPRRRRQWSEPPV